MITFDMNTVINLQNLLIFTTGGSEGVRDLKLLDSATESAFQTFDGVELYPTIEEKGARLGFNLVSNHAFVDGNKRIGLLVMLTFFEINGVKLKYTDEELINLGLSLARGDVKYNSLLNWVISHKG